MCRPHIYPYHLNIPMNVDIIEWQDYIHLDHTRNSLVHVYDHFENEIHSLVINELLQIVNFDRTTNVINPNYTNDNSPNWLSRCIRNILQIFFFMTFKQLYRINELNRKIEIKSIDICDL